MPLGLTRKEQWALLGTIGVIVGAIGVRSYQQQPGSGMVYAEGQGYWKKLETPGKTDLIPGLKKSEAPKPDPNRISPGPQIASQLTSPTQAAPAPQPAAPNPATPIPASPNPAARGVRPAPAPSAPARPAAKAPSASAGLAALAAAPLDINTASAQQLEALPGIGPVKAAAIVAMRQRLGRYTSVDQLEAVSGIGPATMAKIRPYVRIGP